MSERREAVLEAKMREAREELSAIRSEKAEKRNKKLLGKCFKFRNSYGGNDDGWWLYSIVTKATASLEVFKFQTDCNGAIEIESDRYWYAHDGYAPISREEFDTAWAKLVEEITSIQV